MATITQKIIMFIAHQDEESVMKELGLLGYSQEHNE